MTKGIKGLMLSATVLSGIGLCAQTPSGTGAPNHADSTRTAPSSAAAPTTMSSRGTISKYDAPTRTLSLSTPNGTVQFTVSPAARISRGSSKAEPVDLQKLTGNRATVRYTEAGDKKIVESIHVFEENQRRVR
jgi:hypothetical protein